MVIELEVFRQLERGIQNSVIVVYVYFFIFDTTPEALDKDIVQGSTTAVHTDGDTVLLKLAREFVIGELHPLVGIEYFRPRSLQRPFQRADTELFFKGYGYLAGEDVPAVPVYYGH